MCWTKLKDKKPSKIQNYLIVLNILGSPLYEICLWNGRHFTYWDNYNDEEAYYKKKDVIAWMELPKIDLTEK